MTVAGREEAIDLRFELRVALNPLGELGRMLEYLQEEAEGLAKTLGDNRRLARVSVYRGFIYWQSDRAIDARASAQVAHVLAQGFGDFQLEVASNLGLGVASHSAGDYRGAVEFLGKVKTLLNGDKVRERSGLVAFPAVMARAYTAHAFAERGAFDQALRWGRDALALAEQLEQPWSLVIALIAVGQLHDEHGDFRLAIPLLERALALAREWDLTVLRPRPMAALAHAHVMSGRLADASALLEMLQSEAPIQFRCEVLWLLGEVYFAMDQLGEARASAARALELARDGGIRRVEARASHLLGNIAMRGEPPDVEASEAICRAALALAEELGMRPLVAHCHLGLGRLCGCMDRRDQAYEHLTTAATMYRAMDMQFWMEKVDATCKAL